MVKFNDLGPAKPEDYKPRDPNFTIHLVGAEPEKAEEKPAEEKPKKKEENEE